MHVIETLQVLNGLIHHHLREVALVLKSDLLCPSVFLETSEGHLVQDFHNLKNIASLS
jgi:hypothetical protein